MGGGDSSRERLTHNLYNLRSETSFQDGERLKKEVLSLTTNQHTQYLLELLEFGIVTPYTE